MPQLLGRFEPETNKESLEAKPSPHSSTLTIEEKNVILETMLRTLGKASRKVLIPPLAVTMGAQFNRLIFLLQ